jgi:MFS family permease
MGLNAMALFGAAVFMPLYFQLVMGSNPAEAGLRIAPLMGGVIVSSILGGHMVSRTGRYKRFLVGGLFTSTLAFLVMALSATEKWGLWPIEACLVAVGLGLGLVMPNLTIAIQNAVQRYELGVATSTLAFFRSLGVAVGVALAGAIMTSRLHVLLPSELAGTGMGSALDQGIDKIALLPEAARAVVVEAYRRAIVTTFFSGAAFAGLAFLVVLYLPEQPLRGGKGDA